MRKETSEWSVRMLADFERRINVDAEYQRGQVWSAPQQALLIDSILRGFDIPKLYLRKRQDRSQFLFDVIDGKQRLTAIWKFISNEFRLLKTQDPFPGLGNLGGKRWSELPEDAKDELQFANITVSKIEAATDEEIRELFLRLQKGEPLNAAERRNAMSGPVRDFVAEILAKHAFWPATRLRTARYGYDEHSAIALALVSENGPTGLKGADLHRLYENTEFNPDGSVARYTLWILNTMHTIAICNPGYIRTRWGLVDLLLILLRFKADNRTIVPDRIMQFFEKFEKERRSVAVILGDLQTRLVEQLTDNDSFSDEDAELMQQVSPDMLSYYLAFVREGASKDNLTTRSQIMYQKLISFLKGFPGTKDK